MKQHTYHSLNIFCLILKIDLEIFLIPKMITSLNPIPNIAFISEIFLPKSN